MKNVQPAESAKSEQTKVMPRPEQPTGCRTTKEIGGRDGLEPTRYGDWEKNGRCIDF
jgi:hypothetical protein